MMHHSPRNFVYVTRLAVPFFCHIFPCCKHPLVGESKTRRRRYDTAYSVAAALTRVNPLDVEGLSYVTYRQKRLARAEVAAESPERPLTSSKVALMACSARIWNVFLKLICTKESMLCVHFRHHALPDDRCFTDSKLKKSSLQRCYGCGAVLQTVDEELPGYVPLDKYSLKHRHRQLGTLICRSALCSPCLSCPSTTSHLPCS